MTERRCSAVGGTSEVEARIGGTVLRCRMSAVTHAREGARVQRPLCVVHRYGAEVAVAAALVAFQFPRLVLSSRHLSLPSPLPLLFPSLPLLPFLSLTGGAAPATAGPKLQAETQPTITATAKLLGAPRAGARPGRWRWRTPNCVLFIGGLNVQTSESRPARPL